MTQADIRPLRGQQIALLPFEEVHLRDPQYLTWLRDRDVVRPLNLPAYYNNQVSFAELEAYCQRLWQSATDYFYAIEWLPAGRFIGTAKLGMIDTYANTADVGIMIGARDAWGRGLATDVIATRCQNAFGQLGSRRLTAGAMAINPARIRVFEKLGFRREGCARQHDRVDDQYVDHIQLGCMRQEFVMPAIIGGLRA